MQIPGSSKECKYYGYCLKDNYETRIATDQKSKLNEFVKTHKKDPETKYINVNGKTVYKR